MLFTIKAIVEKTLGSCTSRARCWLPAAIVVAAMATFLPSRSFAENGNDESPLPGVKTDAPAGVQTAEPDFEAKFLDLLSAGKQSEAEELVAAEVARYPKAAQLVDLVRRKKGNEALAYSMQNLAEIRPAQRALFLSAVCARSRFDVETALLIFNTVWKLDHETPAAKCAYCVLNLESRQLRPGSKKEVNQAFGELRKLADAHANDLMIRWMLAVQCRVWKHDAEGVAAYKQILQRWNPGPALVHQTYANLLDDLQRYDEALAERYLTVKLEPADWSYEGLANTLYGLSRFDESCQAHAIATRMNPYSSLYWLNWAMALNGQKKHDEAIEKCQRAVKLDAKNWRAYWKWGEVLDAQGKPQEALDKCKTAAAIYARSPSLNKLVAKLQEQLKE